MLQNFNSNWEFYKADALTTYEEIIALSDKFVPVSVPHDWAIEKFDSFYMDATGWYRKNCEFHFENDENVILYFDGIYMDSTIYINGTKVFEWKYGYTQFEVNITPYIKDGMNEICVSVNYLNPNSRWYSGAGITRNVWLQIVPDVYIPRYGIYAHADKNADDNFTLTVDTEVYSFDAVIDEQSVFNNICGIDLIDDDGANVELLPVSKSYIDTACENKKDGPLVVRNVYTVKNPKLWDIDEPNVYTIKVTLNNGYSDETLFGFRTIELTSDKGAYINGRHIKINGVCEHHDFGMLGGAFYEDAMERKIINLKNMGVNSIRLAHNPVDAAVLGLCDRYGMLVMSEAFDMWEHSKTEYDYARFFKEWHEKDVRSWVRQDRNHPCLFMWSIGNEIYDIHMGKRGREIVNELSTLVKKYDRLHNGYITFCSNYMPWENAQKAANDVEAIGYNYAEKYYEEHHSNNKNWIIYGSETSSIAYSRLVYHFPLKTKCLSDDDSQCSAMGNSTTSWGAKSIEECICFDRDLDFSLGQYIWAGHDYLGEPTPYHTKNSYLGIIDTAGYKKDPYYGWKSAYTQNNSHMIPFIYISPEWDYNLGQKIDVRVYSNVHTVELLFNGKSLGKQHLTHKKGEGYHIIADYSIEYEDGTLTAIGYDENDVELIRESRHSFSDTVSLVCKKQEFSIAGKKCEIGLHRMYDKKLEFYDIFALDMNGYVVENASDLVTVNVSGGGRLLALDNGDSTDFTDRSSNIKRLFKGKLLAVVEVTGDESVKVDVSINTDIVPVRRINLSSLDGVAFNECKKTIDVNVNILPENATDKNIEYRITDTFGNESGIAKIVKISDTKVTVEALGDGEFQLRAFSKSSTDSIRVVSQLEFSASGLGEAFYNPYKFVAGSCYSSAIGTVGTGNERGVSTARAAETIVVFEKIDFGNRGSDLMTIPIFSLDHEEIEIDIYDGIYGQDGTKCICRGIYNRPLKWNVYQEETFRLGEKLKGVHALSFRTTEKIHMKGFYCEEYNPAYDKIDVNLCEKVYGDSYEIDGNLIKDIGNNVTIEIGDIDFLKASPKNVTICGRAKGNRNTIHIRFSNDEGEFRNIMECDPTDDICEMTFQVQNINGKGNLQLIFLPGCDYDFKWIKFSI